MTSIVVMGVASYGKSTFGQALAHALSMPWIEGDDSWQINQALALIQAAKHQA